MLEVVECTVVVFSVFVRPSMTDVTKPTLTSALNQSEYVVETKHGPYADAGAYAIAFVNKSQKKCDHEFN